MRYNNAVECNLGSKYIIYYNGQHTEQAKQTILSDVTNLERSY